MGEHVEVVPPIHPDLGPHHTVAVIASGDSRGEKSGLNPSSAVNCCVALGKLLSLSVPQFLHMAKWKE